MAIKIEELEFLKKQAKKEQFKYSTYRNYYLGVDKNKDKLSEYDKVMLNAITEILKKDIKGFISFSGFVSDTAVRVQFDWPGNISYQGVGIFDMLDSDIEEESEDK